MKLGVYYVVLPGVKNPRIRWITRKRSDGRYMMRVPKIGARITYVFQKRSHLFGPEILVPKGASA